MPDPGSVIAPDGDWRYLWEQLRTRTREPAKDFTFVVYVFVGVCLFGGLGIWVEILKSTLSIKPAEHSGLITALLAFFPALIGTTSIQLILASANMRDKVFMSFGIFVLCVFVAAALLLSLFSEAHPQKVLFASSACSIFAVWVWWITNGNDPTYKKLPPSDAATGGAPSRELPGNVSGYRV